MSTYVFKRTETKDGKPVYIYENKKTGQLVGTNIKQAEIRSVRIPRPIAVEGTPTPRIILREGVWPPN